MKTRKLRDLELSPVGVGCMGFSHGYGKIPERADSMAAIRAAHDFGCTFFDTSEVYGRELYYPGHNEEILGEAAAPFRKDVALATKLFIADEEAHENIYAVLRRHLEASMAKLRTDYVDLYYLHRMTKLVPVEDVAAGMGRLIKDGLIRGWGLSAVGVETLAKAQAVTPVTAVQNLYSMVERDAEAAVIPYCLEHGIGFVAFSPVGSGLLSGKVNAQTKFETVDDVRNFVPQLSRENLAGNQPIVDLVSAWAARKQATPAQIAMAWMIRKYPNVIPIPGSKNKGRILENLAAWNVQFTDDEFAALQSGLDACAVFGHRGQEEYAQSDFSKNWIKK